MKQTDKRVVRNTQSVFALQALLQELIHKPGSAYQNEVLLNSLKSQGALSKYCDEKRGIYASSINTLKRICEKSLDGGFDALDRLRIAALESIENEKQKVSRSNKITRTGMSQRIDELEAHNQLLQQELLLLSHLLNKAMGQARYYAEQSDKGNVHVLCDKEQKELRTFLSLSRIPDTPGSQLRVLDNA